MRNALKALFVSFLIVLASPLAATSITLRQCPMLQSCAVQGTEPGLSPGSHNIMCCEGGEILYQFIYNVTAKDVNCRMTPMGLRVSLDQLVNQGVEFHWGWLARSVNVYTVGTDPAFFIDWSFYLEEVAGCNPVGIAFRNLSESQSVLEDYYEFVWIGVSASEYPGTVSIKTRSNGGSVVTTNTGLPWGSGETHALKILVSAAGAVTYEMDGSPITAPAFTLSSGEVMPFFYGIQGSPTGGWFWDRIECGLQ